MNNESQIDATDSEEFMAMCPRIDLSQAKRLMKQHGIEWDEFERDVTATRDGDTWDTQFVLGWLGY